MMRKFMHEIVEYVLDNPTSLKKGHFGWEFYRDNKIIAEVDYGIFGFGLSSVIKFDKSVGAVRMTSQEKKAFKKLTLNYITNVSMRDIEKVNNDWLTGRGITGGGGGYTPNLTPTTNAVNNNGPDILDIAVGVAAGVVVGDIVGDWLDD